MILNRERLEQIEDQILAPYGFRSKNTRGRLFPEDEAEQRTCFQRDRDRVLHTTAFRRLEYKTQVFINYEGDYYRTRLTHTLEVAQIGRTIARALGANEDLVEVICLAHDLGHPPFGHSGETVLNALMQNHGGFEHNRQSYRIVTELENRYLDFRGLNLSWEVLEGLVKHETEFDRSGVREFNPELRGHLEAQISDASDALAYTAHDLDDGLRSGMISSKMLKGNELWELLLNDIGYRQGVLEDLTRHRIIRRLIGMEVADLVETTNDMINKSRISSVDELQRLSYNVVSFSETMSHRNRQLKDFLFKNLYRHYRVIRMAVKAENIISKLFNAYCAEPAMLPDNIQTLIREKGLEQTVCDYIAGMTDRYAIEEFQKIFEPTILP